MRATSQTPVKQRIIQIKNIIFYARAQRADYQHNTPTQLIYNHLPKKGANLVISLSVTLHTFRFKLDFRLYTFLISILSIIDMVWGENHITMYRNSWMPSIC